MSADILLTGTFTEAGNSGSLRFETHEKLRYILSGTWVATVVLEFSQAGNEWETIATLTGNTTLTIPSKKGFYRFRTESFTSGTVTYQIRGLGTTRFFGDAMWDDLKFPASGLNPPGGVSDPGIDTTDGCFLFDAGSTELTTMQAQMPHAWREGSTIVPHVHWTKTTSADGDVVWKIEYQIANPGGTFSGSWTEATGSTVAGGTPDNDTANEHLITSLGNIDMTGYEISCMLKIRISRIGGDASDTYGADAKLLEFDIHYQIDSLGSGAEFTK